MEHSLENPVHANTKKTKKIKWQEREIFNKEREASAGS